MKKLILAAFALTLMGAGAAEAQINIHVGGGHRGYRGHYHRHQVCTWHHRHQVCSWR